MKVNGLVSSQLEELIQKGYSVISMAKNSGHTLHGDKIAEVSSWVSRCGQVIKSLCSENSVYYERYSEAIKVNNFYLLHSNHHFHLGIIQGCILAVRDDLNKGLLVDIQGIIRSEIFGDFLEMAEYLLEEGYKDPAAVIVGAVLEDSLRKLSIREEIPIQRDDGSNKTMEPLNQELYKASVYDKLIQKQITSWADLRNKAAHGHFEQYDQAQVRMMLLFVQKFCSDLLS